LLSKTSPQAKNKSKELFTEAWNEISSLEKVSSSLSDSLSNKIAVLKGKISSNLEQLNEMENLIDPEPIFEFKPQEYVPQKVVSLNSNLYFFSPYSADVFEVDKDGNKKMLSVEDKFNLAVAFSDSIVFFAKPDRIIILKDDVFLAPISLKVPYEDFNPQSLSSFQGSLYFLDNQKGIITTYPYFGSFQWGQPKSWLKSEKAKDFKSLAVDGSLWVLLKENVIERYYAGFLQETLKLEVFPSPKLFSKIFASSQLSYLYLLEPAQKRVVIINRLGQIIRQFQSEKFDNLLDFTVSANGKTIYLLDGLKVYKIAE